jgi:S1-C subfamily serine protease
VDDADDTGQERVGDVTGPTSPATAPWSLGSGAPPQPGEPVSPRPSGSAAGASRLAPGLPPASPPAPSPPPGPYPPGTWPGPTDQAPTAPVWRANEPAVAPGWPSSAPTPGPVPVAPWSNPPPSPAGGSRGPRGWIAVAVVAALVGGGAGAGIAEGLGTGNGSAAAPPVRVGQTTPGPALAGGAQIPTIVKSVLPEVVSIDAKSPGQANGVFGGPTEAQGTGMIISSVGEVITNNHVISGATAITVTLYGQTAALPATLVGADPTNDVALLKITSPPANLQSVTFGGSQQLQVGDAVIAIGNALGLSAGTPTVTSGIVSATGRTVQAGDASGSGPGETLHNMIQTDAAINSGNSGGPLVDSAGDVVGMSTAVASSSSGNAPAQNIGFAIPSDTIQQLLPTLRAGGTAGVSKAYLGVEVTDDTPEEQQAYGLVPSSGALVVSVVSGSPAADAGIQTGDVIVAFNGTAVTSAQGLTNDVQGTSVGAMVHITLYRGSQKMIVTTTLALGPAG